MMSNETNTTDAGKSVRLHDAAQRIARACRFIVEPVLYEWERGDVEQEFLAVILTGLEEVGRERPVKIRELERKALEDFEVSTVTKGREKE